jgi:hypothetical protein
MLLKTSKAVTVMLTGLPAAVLVGLAATVKWLAGPGLTLIVADPVREAVRVSVAVMVWVPGVPRAAPPLKV